MRVCEKSRSFMTRRHFIGETQYSSTVPLNSDLLSSRSVIVALRNRKDLDGIVAVWPSCPDGYKKVYRESFRSPEPQKLKLELEEPEIQGVMAIVKVKETRSGALSSSSNFTAKLMKQGDKWVLQSGVY